ncbi:MAG: preprotein translocase subunit YajC [Candidatus Sabulitectum sp.]|nr:preprotein translocase subunit YajC [Candidatus Sabulitectum sp.]
MGSGGIMGILPIVAMVGIFYFLIIRPQQKQSKKMKEMRESMQKGNNVVTGGGIHGVITNLKGDVVTVRIADSVKIDVDRSALTILSEEVPAT